MSIRTTNLPEASVVCGGSCGLTWEELPSGFQHCYSLTCLWCWEKRLSEQGVHSMISCIPAELLRDAPSEALVTHMLCAAHDTQLWQLISAAQVAHNLQQRALVSFSCIMRDLEQAFWRGGWVSWVPALLCWPGLCLLHLPSF